jgi:UDP-N-acetylglucosamine 4-epimerase
MLPKNEAMFPQPLSPYAVGKLAGEYYVSVYARTIGLDGVSLRYFNVFGPRQDPNGAYAAVMPRWFAALQNGEECSINGDGSTSRDFCFVKNVVQANLKAATSKGASNEVYNVAYGGKTSLLELFNMISERLGVKREPVFKPFRAGDIKDSQADISLAQQKLGYAPTHSVAQGLDEYAAYLKG